MTTELNYKWICGGATLITTGLLIQEANAYGVMDWTPDNYKGVGANLRLRLTGPSEADAPSLIFVPKYISHNFIFSKIKFSNKFLSH